MAPIRPAPGASPGRTRQAADSTDRGGHGDVPVVSRRREFARRWAGDYSEAAELRD